MLGVVLLFSACTGLFDGIYDNDRITDEVVVKEGQIYLDATDWEQWHYINLEDLFTADSTLHIITYQIPLDTLQDSESRTGIYTYWYDVFGEGKSKNEYRSFYPTAEQPEPSEWTFAIHRDNVRTNAGAVYETALSSMDELPESSAAYENATFTEDEWNETDVWTIQKKMLMKLIGNQGIYINPVLSTWLDLEIKSVPPTFTLNNHVFILRCGNGKYAALQLENYQNTNGEKCWLTINYKYPF